MDWMRSVGGRGTIVTYAWVFMPARLFLGAAYNCFFPSGFSEPSLLLDITVRGLLIGTVISEFGSEVFGDHDDHNGITISRLTWQDNDIVLALSNICWKVGIFLV